MLRRWSHQAYLPRYALKERGVALLNLEENSTPHRPPANSCFTCSVRLRISSVVWQLSARKDGIAAARAKGKLPGRRPLDPEKAKAALSLVVASMSPTDAARQLGLGCATVYREMALAGIRRAGWFRCL